MIYGNHTYILGVLWQLIDDILTNNGNFNLKFINTIQSFTIIDDGEQHYNVLMNFEPNRN